MRGEIDSLTICKNYSSKRIKIEQLINMIEPSMLLYFEQGAAEPTKIIQGLMDHTDSIPEIKIIVAPVPGINKMEFCTDIRCDHWKVYTFFGTTEIKNKISDGQVKFIPANTSDIPNILRETYIPDIAIIQVGPPDKNGFCNLGVSVETLISVVEVSKVVVAQINHSMPVVCGQTGIHISEIDYFIDEESSLIELVFSEPGEVEKKIANNVSKYIPDGATIQIGVGKIPDAVLGMLKDRTDLGIHSGLISEKMIELLKLGVITGKKKGMDARKIVGTAILGSKELYDFCDRNPAIELHPVSYTHNLGLASQLNNFISINSAIEIDLTGQVNSENIGGKQISGVGGQLDFIRMARLSKGGKAIIALPSTHKGFSKIIPEIGSNVPVTISRLDVDVVITEYGAAELRYKPFIERAKSLIEIAHPDFRDYLTDWLRNHTPLI